VRIEVGGLSFSVVVDGPEAGPAVVLLHGWPDSSRVWRHQVPALASAGFRVVAPDLRGFGASDRPEGTGAYRAKVLCGDVVGVLDALGLERATVVGHDWGAGLAWMLASVFAPDRVERLAVLAAGHPEAIRNAGARQRQLSWYVLLFQFEGVAERWLTMDDWAHFREFCGGAEGYADVDAAIAELSRPGALTASLEWYRANMTPETLVAPPLDLPPVRCPTLGIWGTGDLGLTEEQMRGSGAYVSGSWRYERLDGAGHWLQLHAPDRINALLGEFLDIAEEGSSG
jgi:pimeloyl-ACP methyl ester carboxylesterase